MCHECRHIMPNGAKCAAPALRGKPYCYFHTRLHGYAAMPAPGAEAHLKLPILEDRSAIQLALAMVFDALGANRIDARRAGLFFYGLQIATQNVERGADIVPATAVHSVTETQAGDELGPETATCPYPFECATCDVSEGCKDYQPPEEEEQAGTEDDDQDDDDEDD